MPNDEEFDAPKTPILRLRPRAPTELIRPSQRIKQPDGPWIAHPDLIEEFTSTSRRITASAPDITMKEHRDVWKAGHAERLKFLNAMEDDAKPYTKLVLLGHIEMQSILGFADHLIASTIERYYVGAHHYLDPGSFMPPQIIDHFRRDWQMNARGVYYRHYYSPGWVTADHSLWLPSLDGIDWNNDTEKSRRTRAKSFLKHVLNNEKWNKSEYAWDADAWTDVFGLMKDDPALAVDKHEYNTIGTEAHEVSCLLTGESKYIKRIPDATFGLATFQPSDYQNAVAEWDLDRERLEALLIHRECGLISDPRWGDTSLAFPFAVFEAKGWNGCAREARQQACSAGRVYLDLLDDMGRIPGKSGKGKDDYQTAHSHNSQVFAYTCFGAHWHIMVGYKRQRLDREYAGYQGMSESVYVFQRIWSGRVTTERTAWELLSFIDQIHLWGVTDFRDFVLRHLKRWHKFAERCYINDVKFAEKMPGTGKRIVDGKVKVFMPSFCLRLPEWIKHLKDDARVRLQDRASYHIQEAGRRYRGVTADDLQAPFSWSCVGAKCRSPDGPGLPLDSIEELMLHLREVHGLDDARIAKFVHNLEEKSKFSEVPTHLFESTYGGELVTSKGFRKRGAVETIDDLLTIKKKSRR